ncbi:MAG: hypothetical protein AAFX46_06960 [Cyanobacteria bacterium J06636_27]
MNTHKKRRRINNLWTLIVFSDCIVSRARTRRTILEPHRYKNLYLCVLMKVLDTRSLKKYKVIEPSADNVVKFIAK